MKESYDIQIITNKALQVLLLEFNNDNRKKMIKVKSNKRKNCKCIKTLHATSNYIIIKSKEKISKCKSKLEIFEV